MGTAAYGASLSDCDTASTSKLLWSDTGAFSCGTDTDTTGSFTLTGSDSGTNQTIASGDTLTIAAGTGIDTTPSDTDTLTVAFDSTEIGTTTWGSGSAITWTFNAGATDPTMAFGSGTITLTPAASNTVLIQGPTTAQGNLDIDVSTTTSNVRALDINFPFTGTSDTNTAYGLYNQVSSTQALATTVSQTFFASYSSVNKSGADNSSGTVAAYGSYSTATNTQSLVNGTKNTYGGYFSATGDASGTTNA